MYTGASALDFHALFRAVPCPLLVVAVDAPRFTIAEVSDAYLEATNTTRDIIGAPLFEVFPDNPSDSGANGVKNLTASLLRVIEQRVPDAMPVQRYDIPRRGVVREFQERHWIPRNAPLLANDGAISHVLHRVEDVTAVVRAGQVAVEGEPPIARKHRVPLADHVDLPRLRQLVRQACAACELDELAEMDLLVAASDLGRRIVEGGATAIAEVLELGLELPRGVQLSFLEHSVGHREPDDGATAAPTLAFHAPGKLFDGFDPGEPLSGRTMTVTKWKRRTPPRGSSH